MYDFLDRPVADLPDADRSLLAAMRGWVHALTIGGDPLDAAARALCDPDAVTPFDRAMRALDRGSADAVVFQRPCHSHVDDVEAVLLATWRQARGGDRTAARATLRLLVDEPAAGEAALAMAQVAALLARAPGWTGPTPSRAAGRYARSRSPIATRPIPGRLI